MSIGRIVYKLAPLALASAVLAGCATEPSVSTEGDTALAAKYGVLSSAEIRDRIIGSTLVSRSRRDDTEWIEYFHPDGDLIRQSMGGDVSWSGFWKVSGPVLCWNFHGASNDHCNMLKLDGDRVTLVDTEGSPSKAGPATLLSGNAYRLVRPGSE